MDKCCWNCGHYRDGKCYCQEEINYDDIHTNTNIGDYIYDMVEEGEIDQLINESETFTKGYEISDTLENFKLTKKQKKDLKDELIQIMEEKLDEFKNNFLYLFINKYKNKTIEIDIEKPVNVFKVNNPKEFYCSRYWE